MSASTNRHKHFWAWKHGRGTYAYKPKFWPVFVSLPVIGLMVWIGNTHPLNGLQDATMADMSARVVSQTVTPSCPGGVCDLSDPAIKAKWDKWEKSPMNILKNVCSSKGLGNDKKCPVILAAMARQESTFGKVMVGDGGHARGWFQVNDTWHNVPKSCSLDLKCSAEWTLTRMIGKGYVKNWEVAVMSHNGTPGTKKTKEYLSLVKHWMKTFVPSLYNI